jgi:cyclopropane fatty-acyl-phospholipid synthase-like methyltransferase|tara:strand:+ start:10224 stop:10823 length:600 start_codon:yes stop_codon:yes gene_type:complete
MYELDKTYTNHFFYTNSISTMPQALFLVPEFIRVFGIKKVLDIGCATGLYLKTFQMNNVSGLGIEGSTIPQRLKWVPSNYIVQKDLRFEINKFSGYDFVLSMEVAEHIEEEYADVYVNNLTKHNADTIFMTAAPPGHAGTAHVNCQPKQYWVDKIEKKGYTNTLAYDDMIKHYAAKATEEGVFIHHWFLPNFMVFKKEN